MHTFRFAEKARDVDPALTFVGNATTIVRTAAATLLTDPSFLHAGEHVHVGYGIRAKRRLESALQPDGLPPIDAVLLSHLHGDHWDPPAERALSRELPILAPQSAARILRGRGFRSSVGLGTWRRVECHSGDATLAVTAVPARHAPGPLVALLPPTNGYVLETMRRDGSPLRVYISGDTLLHSQLADIPKRFPDINVALLHLGGTRIPNARFGVLVTLDARRGVEAVRALRPKSVVPIHTDDWSLFSSSLADFERAMRDAGMASLLRVVDRGETIAL